MSELSHGQSERGDDGSLETRSLARFGVGRVGLDHYHLRDTGAAAVILKLPTRREKLDDAIIVKLQGIFVAGHEALEKFLVLAVAIDRL